MSKLKKEQQKKRKKEQKRKERLGKHRAMLTALGRDDGFLEHIADLTLEGDYKTARGLLLEYVEKYPKNARAFGTLASVCASMEDYSHMFWAAERLLNVGLRTFEDYTIYHTACVANAMPAVLVACEELLKRRFQFQGKENINELREELLTSFRSNAARDGVDVSVYTDEDLLTLMRGQELSTLYLGIKHFDEAIKICDQMIARFPFFASPYNNKALAIMYDRGPDAAESFLQFTLERHPDNMFAIAFKIRQLALLGRHGELPDYSHRLAEVPMTYPNPFDFYNGKIEAFAWADDLERIVELYPIAVKEIGDGWDMTRLPCALTTHYAAVAHARLGNRKTAIELWESIPPGTIETAAENLEDIQKPIEEQNGPWFFSDDHWMPMQFYTMFRQDKNMRKAMELEDEEEKGDQFLQHSKVFFNRAFTLFPSLESTLVEILRRGGPDSRDWARLFIGLRETPKFKAAAIEYVQGQSGSDKCRHKYLSVLAEAEWFVPEGAIRFWHQGEWRNIETFGTQIYFEAVEMVPPLSSAGQELGAKAMELARKGKYEKALVLLEKVNKREPGRAPIMHNIATFNLALGNKDIYDEIIDELAQKFPDYFFLKIALAKRLIEQEQYDEAFSILTTLQKQREMHISEFKALQGTIIYCHLKNGKIEAAKSVYDYAAGVIDEDFPSWASFRLEAGLPMLELPGR